MSFKHLSFIDLFSKENLVVEIPMLQRDYAYGRITETEKRTEFLKSIKGYLLSEHTNHELDFVYGTVTAPKGTNTLILLDGQQRITTLFLLHWYLALANNEFSQFRTLLLNGDKSKFTYNTRESSTDFCNAIVSLTKIIKDEEGNEKIENQEQEYFDLISSSGKISKKIRDEKWFYTHWNNDPTVLNMLNMLDDIAITFPIEECSGLYDKLNKSGKDSSITFNLLPLEKYGLTDELYIKMNSRGKPLTRFENLKSKILKLYDNQKQSNNYQQKLKEICNLEKKEYESLRDYVGLMIDTRWTDMFWNFWLEGNPSSDSKPLVDDLFLSFLINICIFYKVLYLMNGSLSMKRNGSEEEEIESLMDSRNNIPYETIISILQENDNYLLFNIIDILNLISERNDKQEWVLKTYFDSNVYYFNEKSAFKTIVEDYIANDRNYEDKVIFFAYIKYLLHFKPEKNDEKFIDWMRFVYDMCKNSYTLSNAVSTFSNCLAGVNYLCDQDIYKTLPGKDISNIVTLDVYQLEEEILKAKLFDNQKWKEAISNALSKLRYFEGQIHYELIDANNITETDKNDETKIGLFNTYVNKVSSIFNKNDGTTFEVDLIRALLSKGDYTTKHKSSYSLFMNGVGRDISWLRYHKADKTEENTMDKRIYLTKVLTDPDFDAIKPKESLDKIATKYNDGIPEWRKILIKYLLQIETPLVDSDYFKLGTMRLLRWNEANKNHCKHTEDDYEIDLISKLQITSRHAELFTYVLFLDNKNETILPFGKPSYHFQYSEDSQPYMCYGEYALSNENYFIEIRYKDSNQFELRFLNWDETEERVENITNATIIKNLQTNNFNISESNNYFSKNVSKADVMQEIRKFCNSLVKE